MLQSEHGTTGSLVRVRAFVSDNETLVLATLVLLALAGGYLTYATHVDRGTTVETREVATWESTGEFAHRATVVNGTDAFERGTVLRNRSTYFTDVTPTLDGAFTYSYAADGGDVMVDVSTALVVRSITETRSGETTEYWRVERPLDSDRVDSLAPGEQLEIPFSADVAAASDLAERIRRQHGAAPGRTELSVVATVDLTGARNREPVDTTRRYVLPITVEDGVYRVDSPGRVVESGSTTEDVRVPASYGPVRELGSPLLLVASLALLGLFGAARRRGELAVSDHERAALAHASERAEFDEWITTGAVPAVTRRQPQVEVDSLEGLVDVAIDTNERVIEDRDETEFVVLDDGVTYVYQPPASAVDEASGSPAALAPQSADSAATNGEGPADVSVTEVHADSRAAEPPADSRPDRDGSGTPADDGTEDSSPASEASE